MLTLFKQYKNVILISVAAYLIYLVAKYIINKIKEKDDPIVDPDELDVIIEETGQKPTYYPSQYKQFADAIFTVMNNSAVSEAPNKILYDAVKQLKNKVDWLKLIQAYGVRQLRWFGLPDGNPKNLIEALSDEDHLNKVRAILAEKGINI